MVSGGPLGVEEDVKAFWTGAVMRFVMTPPSAPVTITVAAPASHVTRRRHTGTLAALPCGAPLRDWGRRLLLLKSIVLFWILVLCLVIYRFAYRGPMACQVSR